MACMYKRSTTLNCLAPLWGLEQVSRAWINNYIRSDNIGCNYLNQLRIMPWTNDYIYVKYSGVIANPCFDSNVVISLHYAMVIYSLWCVCGGRTTTLFSQTVRRPCGCMQTLRRPYGFKLTARPSQALCVCGFFISFLLHPFQKS